MVCVVHCDPYDKGAALYRSCDKRHNTGTFLCFFFKLLLLAAKVHVKGVDYEEGTISIEHFSFSEYPKEEQILNATQKIIETYETTVQVVDAAKQTAEKMLLVSSPGQGTKLSSEIVGTINPVDLPSSVLPFEHLVCFFFLWIVLDRLVF